MQQAAERSGAYPAHKIDDILILRALEAWVRPEPPVVIQDFPPEDVDQHGRVREGARRELSPTEDGEAEKDRLERLAGAA